MRGGRVRWRAWRARARPGRAGLAAWGVRGRVAQAWAAGARALGAGAGFVTIWTALVCPRSVGEGRGAGQAAERVARPDARQLGGVWVAAGCGPALGFACMRMQRGVLVRLCAGCGMSQDIGKRAQATTHDHSQAGFSRVIMCTFISLQILPAPLAVLRAFPAVGHVSLSLHCLSRCCCHASHAPAVMSAHPMCACVSAYEGVWVCFRAWECGCVYASA